MRGLASDQRVVLTLDAGGTSFRFSGWRARKPVTPTVTLPSLGHDLKRSLANIVAGFTEVKRQCSKAGAC